MPVLDRCGTDPARTRRHRRESVDNQWPVCHRWGMTDASKATEHDDDSGVVVRCVWFFIPLPHPLGLPDQWTMGERLLPRELLAWKGPTSGLSCSLKVHQVPSTANLLLTDHADMWTAALSAITQRPQSDVAADLALQAQEEGAEVPEGLSERVITMIEACADRSARVRRGCPKQRLRPRH
jgi:hypothetical protein